LKKKLLYISYYFPPIHSVASIRNYYFASYFKTKFENIFIYTTSNNRFFPKQELNIKGFEIFNIETFDYRTIISRFSRKKLIHHNESTKNNTIIRSIIRLNDTLPFSILFGEGGLLYILIAYFKAVKLIKEQKITHCYSVFRPSANHIIIYLLKKKFPNLIWIADFHDSPIDYSRKNNYFPSLQWYFYRNILKNTDKITTVSIGLKNQLSKIKKEIIVIRDGVIPRNYIVPNTESFIINYTGSLYLDSQSATLFFKAIKLISKEHPDFYQNLMLTYAGKDAVLWSNWIKEFELNEKANIQNVVSRQEAMQLQDEAAINLLLTWSFPESKGIVTGKIYEYIAASKPILLLINGEQDQEMEAWFDEMKCGKVFYNQLSNVEDLQMYILEIYELWVNGKLATPYISEEIIQSMSWEHQLENILDEI